MSGARGRPGGGGPPAGGGPPRPPATVADEQALYDVAPSFVELLPWVEFLPDSKSMLLEDGQS
ncbi:TraC family protein, partial [Pseudomonas aeruginosa]|nr:TraC family protein [Pseudomonas aeruginosa]